MKDNSIISGRFLLGVLAGSVVGGTVALLYAPKSGRELRNDINRQKDRVLDGAGDYLESAKNKATGIINDSKHKADSILAEAKKRAQEVIQGTGKIYEIGKGKILSKSGKVKNAINAGVEAYRDERIHSSK